MTSRCPFWNQPATRRNPRTNIKDEVNPHDRPVAEVRRPVRARKVGPRNRRRVRREPWPTIPTAFWTIEGLEVARPMTLILAQKLPESARKCH